MEMIKEHRISIGEERPEFVMSDGDAAIKAAIKLVWPLTCHLLCIWHIICKNATDNLKKVIGLENSKSNINVNSIQSFAVCSHSVTYVIMF